MLIFTPSETSFRILERHLARLPESELHWHSDTIEALADIFMSRPLLLVVFGDNNAETLAFIRLVRNNSQFRELPVFAVLPEPERLGQRLGRRMNIERFGTPLDASLLYAKALAVIEGKR